MITKEQLPDLITVAQQRKGDLKKTDLVKISKEMNSVINPTPPLRTSGTIEDILSDIVECSIILEETDELSDLTLQILNHLGLGAVLAQAKLISKKDIVDVNAEPEPDEDDEEPEDEPEDDMEDDMEEPEDDEPEEEPEDEPEEDEAGPIMTDEDLNPEEAENVQIEPDEPDDIPELPQQDRGPRMIKEMSPEEFLDYLEANRVVDRPKKRRRKDGDSPYMITFPIFCKYYDKDFKELTKTITKETGIEINSTTRPAMQTAYSQVRKVVRHLRKFGHLPELEEKKKAATPRKTVKKKEEE